MSVKNDYTRANLLPYIGQPCKVVGFLETWCPSKKFPGMTSVLFTNVTIAIALTGISTHVDHLWIQIDDRSHRRAIGSSKGKVKRLDLSTFNGRLNEYTRTDGSIDISLVSDKKLIDYRKFCKISRSMVSGGQWKNLIDLANSNTIVCVNAYAASEETPIILQALVVVRELAQINLEKLEASKAKNGKKPSGLAFKDLIHASKILVE